MRTELFNDLLRILIDVAPSKDLEKQLRAMQTDIEDAAGAVDMDLTFPRSLDDDWSVKPYADVFMLTSRHAAIADQPGSEATIPMLFDTILADVEVERLIQYMRSEQKRNPDSVYLQFAGHARIRLRYPSEDTEEDQIAHRTITEILRRYLAEREPCDQPGYCGGC